MATFNWPGFGITAITPTLDQPAQVNRSAYTGVRAVASNPWHGKWSFKVQLATKQGDGAFQAIRAFFTGLQGSINNFHLPAVEAPQNANTGVTVATYAAQGATSLALTGVTTALAAGNMVTIAGQLLSLTSVGTLSGSAQTVNFQPALRAAALPVLAAPTLNAPSTATTGGTLAAATYYYKVTALSGTGQTLGSNEVSQVTTGTTSTVSLSWNAIGGATSYRVYRGTAAGAESVYYAPGNVTSFTDTGAASTAGTVPVSNTTQATSVETGKPYALVALTDSSFSWDIAQWRQYGLSFTVDEDVGGTDGASPSGDLWTAPVISGTGGLNTPLDVVTALAAPTGAGMIGFVRTETGAAARTVQSKLRDTVSINDFGADSTGVADTKSAFENASAVGVFAVAPGTYNVSALPTFAANSIVEFVHGVTLTGAGASLTGWDATIGRQTIHYNAQANQYATRHIRRNATYSGGTVGNVASGLRVDTYVSSGATNNEWAIVGLCDNSALAGQNVGVYGKGIKRSTGATWAGVVELQDLSGADPVNSTVALEVDIFGNGTDGNGNRVGIDIVAGRSNPAGALCNVSYGIRMGPQGGSSSNAAFTYGIDLSNATFTNAAIRLGRTNNINLEATGTLQMQSLGAADSIVKFTSSGTEKLGLDLSTPAFRVSGLPVVGARSTGWTAMTGTTDKATAFATSTVTLAQLAGRVMALQAALTTHGLIGA